MDPDDKSPDPKQMEGNPVDRAFAAGFRSGAMTAMDQRNIHDAFKLGLCVAQLVAKYGSSTKQETEYYGNLLRNLEPLG